MQTTLSKQIIEDLHTQRIKHFDKLIERLKLTEDTSFKKGLVDEYMIHANIIDKQIREIELKDNSNQPYIQGKKYKQFPTQHSTISNIGINHSNGNISNRKLGVENITTQVNHTQDLKIQSNKLNKTYKKSMWRKQK